MAHLYAAKLCVYNNGKLDFLQLEGRVSIVLLYDLPLSYTEITMQCEMKCINVQNFSQISKHSVQRGQKCE